MRKFYFLITLLVSFAGVSFSQTTYLWTGSNSTDFQDAANWSPSRTPATDDILSFNVSAAVIVTNVPLQTVGAIKISGGTNSVTLGTNNPLNVLTLSAATPLIYNTAGSILVGDILTIQLGTTSAFTISSGTFGIAPGKGGKIAINGSLTLAGGTLDFDVSGTGGTNINATGSITYTSGTFISTNASSINWVAGSNYRHNTDGAAASAIPASIWQTGSICSITGMNAGNIAPTGFTGIDFANITWNCPAQVGNVYLLPGGSTVNISSTLTILNTNSKELIFTSSGKATIRANNYLQTGGNVTMQASATNDTVTLSASSSFLHSTAGSFNAVGGSSPGIGLLDVQGSVTRGTGATWQSNSSSDNSQFILQFSGATTQLVDVSGGAFNFPVHSRCNIVNNNSDVNNGVSLTGMLRVVNGNSTLPATFVMNGKISGAGGVSYTGGGSGATSLIYGGASFQTATAIEFPASNGPYNLTISNTLGIDFPASFNRTIDGRLTMISGNMAIGAGNVLTLSNLTLANQLSYAGGYITTGTLGRYFPTSSLPTDTSDTRSLFPFGSGANNRSLRVYFSASVLSGGTAGIIYVSHTPVVGVSGTPAIADNGITLDKKTATYWTVSTSASTFNLGGGGETFSLSVVGGNIGAVDSLSKLRLTDGISSYGTLINTNTGTTQVPATGKRGLVMSDINKNLYVGSDGLAVYNPLVIITFTWNGLGGNTAWTNAANWTGVGAVGYPSASTEIAIINSTSGTQPTISTVDNINVFQLTVGTGMTLTMAGNAVLNVYDAVSFNGTAVFAPTSTFGYASSNSNQAMISLPYGGLSVSGTAGKTLPAAITVTGNYAISGATPLFTSNTFTYAGAGAQKITATFYDNLTITGNRGSGMITLGNGTANNTIDIKGVFDVSSLSNFTSKVDYNTLNFSSAGSQNIPGFTYFRISNSNGGPRVYDPLGSTNAAHAITCLSITQPGDPNLYTITNSKVKCVPSGTTTTNYGSAKYYDFELSGDLKGLYNLDFTSFAYIQIAGKFSVTTTNYKLAKNPFRLEFNGTGDQTISGFHSSPGTPAFRYCNVFIAGGNRNVTLGDGTGTDTIAITGILYSEAIAQAPYTIAFGANKGFTVAGSTVRFDSSSSTIPVLKPQVSGGNNYHNIYVGSGTRILAGNMTIGGNVTVVGSADTIIAQLTVGDGNTARIANVKGNLVIGGTGSSAKVTGIVDMNTGTFGSTILNLSDSLKISGYGQLTGNTSDNAKNGVLVFNGTTPQVYSNTGSFKNGLVNFVVGNGTAASSLKLISSMDLLTASATTQNRDTLTVTNNSSIDFGTHNLKANGSLPYSSVFRLQSGATLITANTGGIEGTGSTGANGSISNAATIVKVYNDTASYTFNGVTTTPFPTAITKMANLTIGANPVTLNQSIALSNTLTLQDATTLALSASNLNLRSTSVATARIATVPDNANITYGAGRFVVERYFPARRAWRLITAPVTADASRSIYNSWQIGGAVIPGSGMFVTGPGASPGTNGLDVSPQSNTSLKLFDPATGVFTGIPDTRAQLLSKTAGDPGTPVNIGFFAFVRGDRTSTSLFNTAYSNTTTLRDTGKVQIHNQTFILNTAPANSFELVGNPFASPIDMAGILSSTANILNSYFWAYDPYLNSDQGGYVTMTKIGGVWWSDHPTAQDGNIQSSQAFFVQKSNSAPVTLVVNETDKSAQNNLNVFRPVSQPAIFASRLYLAGADSSRQIADGNLVIFDKTFNSAVDGNDAVKFGNTKETFYMMRNTKALAIEQRQPFSTEDTLFFKLSKTTQRKYQFEFVPTNMDALLSGFLEDSYTGLRTPINLTSPTTFDFSINADAKSAASDRFRIVFKIAGNGPLPVKYTSIKAYQKNKDIAVEWAVNDEINIVKYEVEKSNDGINFSRIGVVAAKGANSLHAAYGFIDANPLEGNNFYRIANYNQTGSVEYSRVVVVKIVKTGTGISVYPNPVKGNMIGVSFTNMIQGLYSVRLTSTLGQTIMSQQINHAAGSSMETLTPGSTLSTGIYQLEITAPDKKISTVKVIVQ